MRGGEGDHEPAGVPVVHVYLDATAKFIGKGVSQLPRLVSEE